MSLDSQLAAVCGRDALRVLLAELLEQVIR